jgi:predicted amidohydrolase
MGDVEANLARMREVTEGGEYDLVLFPEMFLTGYMVRDEFARLAEPLDGPSVQSALSIASDTGAHIMFGMPERDPGTKVLYNTAVLAAPEGQVHSYRKICLANFGPFEEGIHFGRGSELPLWETSLGRIGPLVCYDSFFPELAKLHALNGADLLAVISAAPSTSKQLFHTVLPARAVENAIHLLYANLVGAQLSIVFSGGSVAYGPRGEEKVRGEEFKEAVLEVDVDLEEAPIARRFRPTLRDTREELLRRVAALQDLPIPEALKPRPAHEG